MAKGPGTVLRLPDGIPERLTGGYTNELLRYDDVVLRLERTTLESACWEQKLLRFLAPQLPEAVVATDGPVLWEDGRIASVIPFIPGRALERGEPGERRELARLLARLHRVGLEWTGAQRPGASSWADRDLERNSWWDWAIVDKPPVLVAAYGELVAFLADPPALATGIVHGDVDPANVRVDGGRIVGVVDWEEARLDWPAWELANAAWTTAGEDAGRRAAFVEAYVDAGGPGEPELLPQLTRCRLVADVLYSLTSKARGEAFSQEHVDRLLRALA
jgi:Ser/Thr protein kinase RdoA (MazF antagonist)